jgi:hypothetical protein
VASGLTTENPTDKLGSPPLSVGQAEADKATSKPVTSQSAAPENRNTETKQASQGDDLKKIAPEMKSRSWGDRFKGKLFGFFNHVVVNYALNTIIAATFTYFAEKHILNDNYRQRLASLLHTTQGSSSFVAANYAVSAGLLTMGGTSLLPYMKHAEENKQGYQYGVSKFLDKTQKFLGMGNVDTEKNLADYKMIDHISASIKLGRSHGVSEEEIKRLEEKHHFAFQEDGEAKFDTVEKSWWEMLKARAVAILFSMGTGALLGYSKGDKRTAEQKVEDEERGHFGDRGYANVENAVIPGLADKLQTAPVTKHLVGTDKWIGNPLHFAKLLLEDAILTVVSMATFFFMTRTDEGADAKEVDKNKDGWVSKEEAVEFKTKNPDKRLDRDVDVEEVIHHKPSQRKGVSAPTNGYKEKVNTDRQAAKETSAQVAP